MRSLADSDRAVFPAAGDRRASRYGIAIFAGVAALCAFLCRLAWMAWSQIEDPKIRWEATVAALGPIWFLWTVFHASGRSIRYELSPGELFVVHGRRSFFIPLGEIAGVRRMTDEAFFNPGIRFGGRSSLFRPILLNDRRLVGLIIHLQEGRTYLCVNPSPEYCLLTLTEKEAPKLLISPERMDEFLELLERRMAECRSRRSHAS